MFQRTLIILFLLLFPISISVAQVSGFGGSLRLSISPNAPSPGDSVEVSVNHYSQDLNRSIISWFIDGSLVSQGVAESKYVFVAPPSGTQYDISVEVLFENGNTQSSQVSIRPSSVSLIWESDGYSPPFYKGKALHSSGGNLQISALPTIVEGGVLQDTRSIIYTWKKNGEMQQDASGYGKSVFETSGSRFGRTTRISVTAESVGGGVVAKKSIIIPTSKTKVVVYEKSPLIGIRYERGLKKNFNFKEDEVVLEAYPYHFSSISRNGESIQYDWRVENGKVEPSEESASTIVLRAGEGFGKFGVSVGVTSLFYDLQSALSDFVITFGDE